MQTSKKNVGLYYGSFNPIHIGHLVVAKKALEDTDLDEVWFVVSPHNPHKDSNELIDENHRFDMVKIAILDEDNIKACDIEFDLPQPSYTYVGLRLLREKYKDIHFTIIGGSDVQRKISTWKEYKEILENHDLLIYPRILTDGDLKYDEVSDYVESKTTYITNVPRLEISATYLREHFKKEKSVDYLITKPVINYIKENNLFI